MQDEWAWDVAETLLRHTTRKTTRLTIDEHIDERTLREIYLSAFETDGEGS
jgi:uncharacterized protein YnzC (UPF0291/DUF896 family)